MPTIARRVVIPALVAVGVALCAPALARDVIIFTNGKHLSVDSHEIIDGMVYVDIGDDEMAFPREQVEDIVTGEAGTRVRAGGNRMVAGGGAPERAAAATTRRATTIEDDGLDGGLASGVEEDDSGTSAYRPFARSPAANRRGLAVTGSHRVTGGPQVTRAGDSDLKGVTRMGDRLVIGATGPRRRPGERAKPIAVPLEALPNGPVEGGRTPGVLAPPAPRDEAPAAGSDGDGS